VDGKPIPIPTPESKPFWDGCREGELRLQRCVACDRFYFPPQSTCPNCASDEITWAALSGRATLHTYLINHTPAPGFEEDAPYAIAIVQLEEGPRMMSNIIGVDNTPEALVLDMDLEVVFVPRGDVALPQFRPARPRSI
jgi:hypothetical protein